MGYWKIGFHVESLTRSWLGKRDLDNIILYQEMQRLQRSPKNGVGLTPPLPLRVVPRLFTTDVVGEVVKIDYPAEAGGGSYEVVITSFKKKECYHTVDSSEFPVW